MDKVTTTRPGSSLGYVLSSLIKKQFMRKSIGILAILLLTIASAIAQVQIDKPIDLSGAGPNAKITGIKDVSNSKDAVSAEALQSGKLVTAISATGTNSLTLTFSPPLGGTLQAGTFIAFKAVNNNAAGGVTLTLDGVGPKSLFKNVNVGLAADDIKAGQMITAIYDGTNFQLLSRGEFAEVDGSITNEGTLGVGAGGASSSVITTNTSGGTGVTINASTGLSIAESTAANGGSITLTNSAPDQTVSFTNGTGISVTGTYPAFTVTNTAPSSGGTVTSIGTGSGLTGGPITSSGTISISAAGVTNAMLANPSLTVTAGTGLSGGGSVPLGGSTTISLATPVSVANGGTGTGTSLTAGSVVFAGTGGVFSQNNGNFFWDNTNKFLGIGYSAPGARLSFNNLNDGTNGSDGITWYSPDPLAYGIYRTSGGWTGPNYQQLKLSWSTGVTIDPGTAYGKSYLEVVGNGVRVTSGSLGVGTAAPGQIFSVAGTIGVSETGNTGNRLQISSTGAGAVIFQNDNSPIIFKTATGTQEKMRIGDDGTVGIGTNGGANEALSVYKAMGAWQARFANSSGSGADVYLAHGGGYGMHIRGWNTNDAIYTLEMYNSSAQTNAFYNSGRVALGMVGNVGINNTLPQEKLDVNGNILWQAVSNIDNVVSTYKVTSKRYYVSSKYSVNGNKTVPLDMNIINELCADEDGCRVSLYMRRWTAGTESEGATDQPIWVFFYNSSDHRWRLGGSSGIDGSGGTQHILHVFGCYFTDGSYSGGTDLGDGAVGLGLLNWNENSYNNANKTCELVIDD
jgi:hypothetical protein